MNAQKIFAIAVAGFARLEVHAAAMSADGFTLTFDYRSTR
jgi:hypothetical protein